MKAVHFGAGNIGRGFIGELLYESGFSTTFVDVVKATVDYINETNSYEMYIIDNNEKKVIKNVKLFLQLLMKQILWKQFVKLI